MIVWVHLVVLHVLPDKVLCTALATLPPVTYCSGCQAGRHASSGLEVRLNLAVSSEDQKSIGQVYCTFSL